MPNKPQQASKSLSVGGKKLNSTTEELPSLTIAQQKVIKQIIAVALFNILKIAGIEKVKATKISAKMSGEILGDINSELK